MVNFLGEANGVVEEIDKWDTYNVARDIHKTSVESNVESKTSNQHRDHNLHHIEAKNDVMVNEGMNEYSDEVSQVGKSKASK